VLKIKKIYKLVKALMKKTYISPLMEVAFVGATEMMATSLPIGNGTVDGGDALGKENNWDIWGNDPVEE